jgi:integral membrane protein (TIGR01906 family)
MTLKILGIIAKWLFILCLPILLLSASLAWALNSHWLYNYGFEKYSLPQHPELAEFDLEGIGDQIISYFNSSEEPLSIIVIIDGQPTQLFTPEETIHFRDVKGLVWLDYWILGGTLVYVLAYAAVSLFWRKKRYWPRLAWGLVIGGSITLGLMLALGLGTLLGFDRLFWNFHLVFFSNEYWLSGGNMTLLFTEEFFYDAALFCALGTAGMAVILGGVGGGWLIFNRKRAKT